MGEILRIRCVEKRHHEWIGFCIRIFKFARPAVVVFGAQDGETDGFDAAPHTSPLDEVINLKLERNELHRLDRVPREHRVVIRA